MSKYFVNLRGELKKAPAIGNFVYVGQEENNRWYQLFGTPERATHTLLNINCHGVGCERCSLGDTMCDLGETALLKWLRGE